MSLTGPTLLQAYVDALREHAHWLIAEGYERMDKAAFAQAQEPAITGELVREMRSFLESGSGAPTWVSFFSIHDDPPLNVGGRLGRSRPRVDIEFERIAAGKRPRLRFEAKRLRSATRHTVARYLGEEGLGCFLTGKYPATHGEAGMLGYAQSDDEVTWAERIASRLSRDEAKYGTVPPPFAPQVVHAALRHTYVSHHLLAEGAVPIVIHHVMLRFG
jgi:hypothetical protein